MRRHWIHAVALAVCLVVAAAAAPVGGLVVPAGQTDAGAESVVTHGGHGGAEQVTTETPDEATETNVTDDGPGTADGPTDTTVSASGVTGTDATAGEALASAVAAHDTDLEGEVRRRAFDRRLAATGNETRRARLLDDTVQNVQLRLTLLADRRARLRDAYRNGTISQGHYRVELARLTGEARSLRRLLDRADGPAARLSPDTRAEFELENTTFADLRTRADAVGNRSGTGLDELLDEPTRTLAPDWNGTLLDDYTPNGTDGYTLNGTDGYTLNGTDSYDDGVDNRTATEDRYDERRMTLLTLEGNATRLEDVHDHLADRSDGDREVEEALTCAREALADARTAIDDTRSALDDGDPERADDRIADARAALTTARDCLAEARAALEDDGSDDGSSTRTPTDWSR